GAPGRAPLDGSRRWRCGPRCRRRRSRGAAPSRAPVRRGQGGVPPLRARGREVAEPVRRLRLLVEDGLGGAGGRAGGITAAEVALEGLLRLRVVEHRAVRTRDRAELAAGA